MSKPIQMFARRQGPSDDELAVQPPPDMSVLDEIGGALLPSMNASEGTGASKSAAAGKGNNTLLSAERAVVGALIADNTLFDSIIDIARAQDFSDPVVAAVFAAIEEIVEGNSEGISVADPITLASLPNIGLLASIETLTAWRNTASVDAQTIASYARIVCNAAAERHLGAAVVQAQSILKEERPLGDRAEAIQQALTVATDVRSLPVISMGAAAVQALSDMAERAQRGETGVGMTTGFPDLDAILAGLHGGQLIVLAARPGVGKTAFAISLGLGTAAAGNPTLMVSMEMKAKELSKRGLAIISGVDSHVLRLGALSEADWEAAVSAGEYLSSIPFELVDLPSVNLANLSMVCRRLHREGKLKLLIIDYLQIMETTAKKNGNREQEVAALSRGLKKLAMQLDIPIIALSQLNRAVESRLTPRPKMSDLRESGALEQDADVIMFIHREAAADISSSADETAEIIVEKQREGPTGVVNVGYAKRTTRFYSLATPSYGSGQARAAA